MSMRLGKNIILGKSLAGIFLFSMILTCPTAMAEGGDDKDNDTTVSQPARPGIGRFVPNISASDVSAFCSKAYKGMFSTPTRRAISGTGIGVAGLGLAGVSYTVAYNMDYKDGEWSNVGTKENPLWVPVVGENLYVEKLNGVIGFRNFLRVHNKEVGHGHVFYERDTVEYRRGDDVVAKTNIIDPNGWPYNKDIPIEIEITDANNKRIGTVYEYSHESEGVHDVHFEVLDNKGKIIGKTDTFKENYRAKPITKPWGFNLSNEKKEQLATLSKEGTLSTQYHWKREKPVDPRLLVVLASYKALVDRGRSK